MKAGRTANGAPQGVIHVRICYHSTIREETGTSEEQVAFPMGSRLSTVTEWLAGRYGIAVPGPTLLAAVNGFVWNRRTSGPSASLSEGDEIALFPLLVGG